MSSPHRTLRIVVAFAALFAWSQPAAAQLLDDLEAKMAVLDEVLAGVATTMIEFTGQCDPTAKLDYQVRVEDTGFSLAGLNGTYASKPVDVDIATRETFGFYDVGMIGMGADVDFASGVEKQSVFDTTRMIQLMNVKANVAPWDFHVIKNYTLKQVSAGFQIRDDGLVVIAREGRPIAKYKQTSVFQRYPPFKRTLTKTRIAPSGGCIAILKGNVNGNLIAGKVVVKLP